MARDKREPNERLREARAKIFNSARSAATSNGWALSTYGAHEDGRRRFKPDKAEKYARAFGVSPDWLLFGTDKGTHPEANLQPLLPVNNINDSVRSLLLAGVVAAGIWREVDMTTDTDNTVHTIPDPRWPDDWQFILKVCGNSLNKLAQDGDVLLCLSLGESNTEIKDGDLVIVERTQQQGGLIETTAKRVRRTKAGYELWPESSDPLHQEPFKVDDDEMNQDMTVRVIALVIAVTKRFV